MCVFPVAFPSTLFFRNVQILIGYYCNLITKCLFVCLHFALQNVVMGQVSELIIKSSHYNLINICPLLI